MCGIAGLNRAAGRSSIPDAREFARQLAYAVESRGKHATGFGWEEEGWPTYWKSPGRASVVAYRAPLPTGMRNVIVHCRYATHGQPSNNANNHPVTAPGIVLVHNGKCTNYGELIALLGYDRKDATATVDSEAIAALLASADLGGSVPDRLTLIEGTAALAWLDTDTSGTLHLARLHGRPLAFAHTRRGDFVFASTPEALTAVSQATGVWLTAPTIVAPGTYLRVVDGVVVECVPFDPPPPPPDPPRFRSLDRLPYENASQHASRRAQLWSEPMDDDEVDDWHWRDRMLSHGNLTADEVDGIVRTRRYARTGIYTKGAS